MKKYLKYLILLLIPFLLGAAPVRDNTYVDKETIEAADVTANEDAIFDYLQTGVTVIGTDAVKDTHIDWGSNANQVDTDDIPEGVTNKFEGTTITGDSGTTTGEAITISGSGISSTAVVGDVLTITSTEVDNLDAVCDRQAITDQTIQAVKVWASTQVTGSNVTATTDMNTVDITATGTVTGAVVDTQNIDNSNGAAVTIRDNLVVNGTITGSGGDTTIHGSGTAGEIAKFSDSDSITDAVADTDYLKTLAGDLATTSPITGAVNNIFPGSGTKATIAINDAAADDSTKGAATFEADDFDSSSGKIDLATSVVKSVATDGSASTPSAHEFTIAGAGIAVTSGAAATVTVTATEAQDIDAVLTIGATADTENLTLTAGDLTAENVFADVTVTGIIADFQDISNSSNGNLVVRDGLTISGSSFLVDGNTVDLSDTTEDDVLTFNAVTNTWSGEASGGAGASTALDNLASVQINTTLLSDTADTDSLGTTVAEWLNLYIGDAGKIYVGLGQDGELYSSSDDIYLATVTQDKDLYLRNNDGGSQENSFQLHGDSGIISRPFQSSVRVYPSATQTDLTDVTFTKVTLDTEDWDTQGEFASSTFTATEAGKYLVVTTIQYQQVPTDKTYWASIYVNGAATTEAISHTASTTNVSTPSINILNLAATNTVELYARVDCGVNTVDVKGGSLVTYMAIDKID